MILNKTQIVALAGGLLADLQKISATIETNIASLNDHNATQGATGVNPGPLSVVRGCLSSAIEQAQKHVAENTPAPVAPPVVLAARAPGGK